MVGLIPTMMVDAVCNFLPVWFVATFEELADETSYHYTVIEELADSISYHYTVNWRKIHQHTVLCSFYVKYCGHIYLDSSRQTP